MQKILITGASGFVGKEICKTLESRNILFVPAVRNNGRSNQIEVGDLTGTTNWTNALSGCDVVIHLAARVHVMQDKATVPLESYRKVNVEATMNLARQALASGVKRFIFVSSVKVNGEWTINSPFSCQDQPKPLDPYGQSKFEAETALQKLSDETGLEVVIVRPPLVYGPGVQANFLRLMRLIQLGIPLPFGKVQNRRSMVALDNLIDLLILCTHHPNAAGKKFMVSDDYDLSLHDLIQLISHSMGKKTVLIPIPLNLVTAAAHIARQTDNVNRLFGSLQVDISETKKVLGWKPVQTVDVAIEKTVLHFLKENP